MSDNPYRPPQPAESSSGDEEAIRFDGATDVDDLASLLAVPRIVWVLRATAFFVLAPFLVIPIVATILSPADWPRTFPVFLIVIVLSAMVAAANHMLSRKRRTRRLAKTHPDLLGPQRGKLDAFGLTFHSGQANETQRISWAAFPQVAVNSKGVRFDWRSGDGACIPIPEGSFESFDVDSARKKVAAFRELADAAPIFESLPVWENAPQESIAFQTLVPIRAADPLTSRLWAGLGLFATIVLAGLTVVSLLSGYDRYLPELVIATLVAIGVAFSAGDGRSVAALSWRAWGWLTPTGGQLHLPGAISEFRWEETEELRIDSDQLVAVWPDGSSIALIRADLNVPAESNLGADSNLPTASNPDRWEELADWLRREESV